MSPESYVPQTTPPKVKGYLTRPAGTLLDRNLEIDSKLAYQPNSLEQQYNAAIYAEFDYALWQFQTSHKFFNDQTLVNYMQRNQLDVVSYVAPKRDPYDWRNHRRSTVQYDKTAALLSFFIDLNFQCEPTAQDWLGRMNPEMAEVASALLQHANIMDSSDEKEKLADYAMLVDGTVSEEIAWVVKKQVAKSASAKWTPDMNPAGIEYTTRWSDVFEGIETKLMKLNRVLLGDISKVIVKDQPYLFKEYVISYDSAYQLFHNYYAWRFVKPYDPNTDQWTDTDTDIEIEESNANIERLVRVRVYENVVRNEYALYCNKVLMTPVGMPLPYGRFSITWQQAGLLNHHFSYGRSFVGHLRADVATRDILYSLFIDKSRQGLEPPMKSTFKALVNRHMFRPGAITPMQGGDLSPLIPENALQNFAKDAISMLENSIDRASVSPIFQGQGTSGSMTKYEVEQQLINSIRTAALIVSSTVNRRRQKAEAMFELILTHYPELSFGKLASDSDDIKRFVVSAVEGTSDKEIMFQPISDKTSPKQMLGLTNNMLQGEKKARKSDHPVKKYLVDPDSFRAHKYVFNYRVNPQQRDSKATDIAEVERKYNMYMQNPFIDPIYPTKMMLRANGDDVNEAIKKQSPDMGLGQPGQGQPQGQPQQGQPQAQPMGQKSQAVAGQLPGQKGIAGTPPLPIAQAQQQAANLLSR